MLRKTPLFENETYHIYNRGAHKHQLFTCEDDYSRFLALLHLSNHRGPIALRDILAKSQYKGRLSRELFLEPVDKSLVDILGYALLPNHFHLILRQKAEEGITAFMRKLGVAYSMYFNLKYQHEGTLFQGRFKSRHIATDPYFKWIFPYVHLNPISLVESSWEEKKIQDLSRVRDFLSSYAYCSFRDYYGLERPERAILAFRDTVDLIDTKSDLEGLLADYARGQVLYRDEALENRPRE